MNELAISADQMHELSLFSGAGGGLLASTHLLGFRTVCYVEHNDYRIEVLKARIRDGLLHDAPIWDDATTFDGRPWRGTVDILTAGFPCTPWASGGKEIGEDDPRNLWPDTVRIIGEVRPTWVLLENSPNLLQYSKKYRRNAYFERMLYQLAEVGYVCRWGCLSAASVGAQHKRERVWIVAYSGSSGWPVVLCGDEGDGQSSDESLALTTVTLEPVWSRLARLEERLGEPSVFRTNDGISSGVDRLAAVGDAQVPRVVEIVWRILTGVKL